MGVYPDICPKCSERNTYNLNFCAVCGSKFLPKTALMNNSRSGDHTQGKDRARQGYPKKLKRKRELLTAFREGRITEEKLKKGLKELGGSEEVEAALEFKKFIAEQIRTFERMDLTEKEGDFPDPNESLSDLPRDENGAPLTDFMASKEDRELFNRRRPHEPMPSNDVPLFMREGAFDVPSTKKGEPPKGRPRMKVEVPRRKVERRTVGTSSVQWDDEAEEDEDFELDLDEELSWGDEDEEEQFVIELKETPKKRSKRPLKGSRKHTLIEWLPEDGHDDNRGRRERGRTKLK